MALLHTQFETHAYRLCCIDNLRYMHKGLCCIDNVRCMIMRLIFTEMGGGCRRRGGSGCGKMSEKKWDIMGDDWRLYSL